jgi:hypothetical protein
MTTYTTSGFLSNGLPYTNYTYIDAKVTSCDFHIEKKSEAPSVNEFICKRTDNPLKSSNKIGFRLTSKLPPQFTSTDREKEEFIYFGKYKLQRARKCKATI